jgi:hypothetical protein
MTSPYNLTQSSVFIQKDRLNLFNQVNNGTHSQFIANDLLYYIVSDFYDISKFRIFLESAKKNGIKINKLFYYICYCLDGCKSRTSVQSLEHVKMGFKLIKTKEHENRYCEVITLLNELSETADFQSENELKYINTLQAL